MSARAVPFRLVAAVSAVAAAALVAGCSSSGGSGRPSGGDSSGSSAAGATGAHTASITITQANGCQADHTELAAGGATFRVKNKDATAVSELELQSGERIVGETENIPPGLGGSFSVPLEAGKYVLYCPGAKQERTTLTVTGKPTTNADASTSGLLAKGTALYAQYVTTQVAYLVDTTKKLDAALHGTDLQAAQVAYMKARPYYEKIEPVAESFTVGKDNLDFQIDVRVADVGKARWTGFHRIEKALFADKKLAGLRPLGDKLVADAAKLQKLTTGLSYKPFELANGAQDLLNEVATSKISGEEEAYSQIDLLDFEANDEAAEQAFADLQPALQKVDPALVAKVSNRFAALNTLLDTYRTSANPSGFTLYPQLTAADKRALAAAVKAVQEPLSQVASKVAQA